MLEQFKDVKPWFQFFEVFARVHSFEIHAEIKFSVEKKLNLNNELQICIIVNFYV